MSVKDNKDTPPFATLPQSVLYSHALDDLDIRLLLHFECTYRLEGEIDTFEYSVPALHTLFPHYGRQLYRRKVKKYTTAGVLTFTRFKVIRGKRIPLYKYDPSKLKLLCGPGRPHSKEDTLLCGPGRPDKKEDSKEPEKKDKKESTSTAETDLMNMEKTLNAGFGCKSVYPSIVPVPHSSSTGKKRFSVPNGIDDKFKPNEQDIIERVFIDTVLEWQGARVPQSIIQKRLDAFKVQAVNVHSAVDVIRIFKAITDKEGK
jgi:hypothetical protein